MPTLEWIGKDKVIECDANCKCRKKYKNYNPVTIWYKFKTK